MSEGSEGSRWTVGGVVAGVILVFFSGVAGVMLGGLYVRFFVPKTGMGWDQLADALGGLMLGGLLGLAAGAILAFALDVRRRFLASGVVAAIAVLVFAGMALTAPDRPESEPFVREEPFRPMFMLKMNVGRSDEILRAMEPERRPIPFTEVKVFTATEEMVLVDWDLARCRVEVPREELARLTPLAEALYEEGEAGHCRTPAEDDIGVSFYISIDGEQRTGTVQSDCLAERPAQVAAARAIGELASLLCP